MSKILITGGGGYVGSMLTTTLVNLGHEVSVIDLMKYDKGSLNHLYYQKNFKLIQKDIREKNTKVLNQLNKQIQYNGCKLIRSRPYPHKYNFLI